METGRRNLSPVSRISSWVPFMIKGEIQRWPRSAAAMAGHEALRYNIGEWSILQEMWNKLWSIGWLLHQMGSFMPCVPWEHALNMVLLVGLCSTQLWQTTTIPVQRWGVKPETNTSVIYEPISRTGFSAERELIDSFWITIKETLNYLLICSV